MNDGPNFAALEAKEEAKARATIPQQTVVRDMKPATQLSDKEIVTEARSIHAHFQQLAKRFESSPPGQRTEIREEMAPLVNRERELRAEYTGRIAPEINSDRVPEQQLGYSR